jgi:hypothetical protein
MLKRMRKEGAGVLVALIAVVVFGAAACSGCSANESMRAGAKTGAAQLGRVNVLIDQCSQGSVDPGSCADAKVGVNGAIEQFNNIQSGK